LDDGSAVISDAATGEPLASLQVAESFVNDVAFTADGARLLTFDADGFVRTWSLPEGRELSAFRASRAGLLSGAISPDGSTVAIGDHNGGAALFDSDGTRPRRLADLGGRVSSVEFSPDSTQLLTASEVGGTRLWRVADGTLVRTLGESDSAQDAAFRADGKTIATANLDGSAEILSARTGERLGRPLQQSLRGAFITRVAFVPGEPTVITAGGGGAVTAWDLVTRDQIDQYRGHAGFVLDVAVGDDRRLLTAGADGTARLWDLGARAATIDSAAVATPRFSADSRRLLFADGLAEIVDAATGRPILRIVRGAPIFGVSFSPDESQIAAAEGDGRARIYSAADGEPTGRSFDHGGEDGTYTVQWSADGARLMTVGGDSGAKVWDYARGNLIAALPPAIDDAFVFDAALSPDGRTAVTAEGRETVELRPVDGEGASVELSGHTDAVNSVSFDGSGDRVLTASDDGTARIWDAADGDQLQVLNNDGFPVRDAAFSPRETLVATSGANGELRIWDAANGLEILRLGGANGAVAISPDDTTIVGADSVAKQATIFECEVCAADLDQLIELAEERITREPTAEERARYLGEED
jgi:WD40 repeat protein